MRSNEPMPGNPWPHDMVMSIDDTDHTLLRLLFARVAWGIRIPGEPTVAGLVDVGTSRLPAGVGAEEAAARWQADWAAGWERYAVRDRRVKTLDAERVALLEATRDEDLSEVFLRSPLQFWNEGIDDEAFVRWNLELMRQSSEGHQIPLEETPERRSLPALISAWRAGLTRVVQLPYEGYFADRINRECLVVSRETRQNPRLYTRALLTA